MAAGGDVCFIILSFGERLLLEKEPKSKVALSSLIPILSLYPFWFVHDSDGSESSAKEWRCWAMVRQACCQACGSDTRIEDRIWEE